MAKIVWSRFTGTARRTAWAVFAALLIVCELLVRPPPATTPIVASPRIRGEATVTVLTADSPQCTVASSSCLVSLSSLSLAQHLSVTRAEEFAECIERRVSLDERHLPSDGLCTPLARQYALPPRASHVGAPIESAPVPHWLTAEIAYRRGTYSKPNLLEISHYSAAYRDPLC